MIVFDGMVAGMGGCSDVKSEVDDLIIGAIILATSFTHIKKAEEIGDWILNQHRMYRMLVYYTIYNEYDSDSESILTTTNNMSIS